MSIIPGHNLVVRRIMQLLNDTDTDEALNFLQKSLPDNAGIYIAGGAIRDILIAEIHGTGPPTEDIDIFIENVPDGIRPADVLDKEQFEVTDLGGLRWRPENATLPLDICLLEDFVIIEKYKLEPNLKNFLDTIEFTVNAVVFDYPRRRLHMKQCVEDVEKRFIDFNTHLLYTKVSTAFRTIVLRFKTGFRLSEAVFSFLKNDINFETVLFLKHLFKSRFKVEITNRLMSDFNRISRYRNYRDYIHGFLNLCSYWYHCIYCVLVRFDNRV